MQKVALSLLASVGLREGNSRGQQGQPSRSGVGLHGRVIAQPLALQQLADPARQLFARAVDHAGGDFFGTDFEKEVHKAAISN